MPLPKQLFAHVSGGVGRPSQQRESSVDVCSAIGWPIIYVGMKPSLCAVLQERDWVSFLFDHSDIYAKTNRRRRNGQSTGTSTYDTEAFARFESTCPKEAVD